jgi:hypothetical protein
MTMWYVFCSFGNFFPVLVSCTKKNLATLVRVTRLGDFSPIGPLLTLGRCSKFTEIGSQFFGLLFRL